MVFIELNDGRWEPDPPDVDQAEEAMLAVAVAAGEVDDEWFAAWFRERVHFQRILQRTVRHRPVVTGQAVNSRPAERLRPPTEPACTMLGGHG